MQSNKCLGRLQGQLYKPLEAHQSSHYWPWSVIKRSIKTTITVTTARNHGNVYIYNPPSTNIRYIDSPKSTLSDFRLFVISLKTSYTDFGIGGIVAGTTLVTTSRDWCFYCDVNEGWASFGCGCNYWRICTSSTRFGAHLPPLLRGSLLKHLLQLVSIYCGSFNHFSFGHFAFSL